MIPSNTFSHRYPDLVTYILSLYNNTWISSEDSKSVVVGAMGHDAGKVTYRLNEVDDETVLLSCDFMKNPTYGNLSISLKIPQVICQNNLEEIKSLIQQAIQKRMDDKSILGIKS